MDGIDKTNALRISCHHDRMRPFARAKESDAAKIALEHGCRVAAMPEGWPNNSDVSDLAQRDGLDALGDWRMLLLPDHANPQLAPIVGLAAAAAATTTLRARWKRHAPSRKYSTPTARPAASVSMRPAIARSRISAPALRTTNPRGT